jgi:hypothetical protein
MQLSTDIAQSIDQLLLDMHMDVFELKPERHLAPIQKSTDLSQFSVYRVKLVGTDQPLPAQHLGVRLRTSNVLLVQSVVKRNAFAKSGKSVVSAMGKYATS